MRSAHAGSGWPGGVPRDGAAVAAPAAFLFVTGYADAGPHEEFLRTVPVPAWFWRHIWSPLLDKAAVGAIRIHDARHTYASLMLRRGVPIAYVSRPPSAEAVGHALVQNGLDWDEGEPFMLFYKHAVELLQRQATLALKAPPARQRKRKPPRPPSGGSMGAPKRRTRRTR